MYYMIVTEILSHFFIGIGFYFAAVVIDARLGRPMRAFRFGGDLASFGTSRAWAKYCAYIILFEFAESMLELTPGKAFAQSIFQTLVVVLALYVCDRLRMFWEAWTGPDARSFSAIAGDVRAKLARPTPSDETVNPNPPGWPEAQSVPEGSEVYEAVLRAEKSRFLKGTKFREGLTPEVTEVPEQNGTKPAKKKRHWWNRRAAIDDIREENERRIQRLHDLTTRGQ